MFLALGHFVQLRANMRFPEHQKGRSKTTLTASRREDLNLLVKVNLIDFDEPGSADELSEELMNHVVKCTKCLAAILGTDTSLTDVGCPLYKAMAHIPKAE